MLAKTSKRVKVVCFAFWCFFYAKMFSVRKKKRKKKRLEIVPLTSITTLLLRPVNPLTAEGCSQTRPTMHSSNHVFGSE